jgi:putative tryptophan/tyrosine transport system substrate-binding protein
VTRREFIAALGSVMAWPMLTAAQQPSMPVVGYLSANLPEYDPGKRGFLKGLGEAGFGEGRNVAIEYRYAHLVFARLPELAADLVRRRVNVIATEFNAATQAAKAATESIPIVFSAGGDPVALGVVASLARPASNLTGASFLSTGTTAKMLEVLRETVPNADIAALFNPANPTSEIETRELQQAARVMDVKLEVFTAANKNDIDVAFAMLLRRRASALIIQGDPLFTSSLKQLVALTLRHGIPSIYNSRDFPDASGLMSYGGSLEEAARIAGLYVGRILRGEKPTDLPVQQVAKVELIINLATAKALGLTIPETLLATADEVIQ